jgi:ectoine hydroxylase-related dioxygenase (phytanoyl-CoA dioxygenase family)
MLQMKITAMYQEQLKTPFPLTEAQIEFYRKNAYIKIKQLLPEEVVVYYNTRISEKVAEMNRVSKPLEERDTYEKAFLQLFNLWREDPEIKEFIFSSRLAGVAARLMEVSGVRLYHDQALFKEGGGGITPWHADQYYWPLSSDKTITAWIPLQATPLEMGPLEFSAGSHQIQEGRALSISDESETLIGDRLRVTDFPHTIEPFDIGEVSFHSGWVFHRAGANATDEVRKVITIIYMDQDIQLKAPENEGQQNDWETWCPGVEIGTTVNSPLNPVLFTE